MSGRLGSVVQDSQILNAWDRTACSSCLTELKNLHGSTEKHVRIEARTEDAHGGALLALPPDLEKNRQRIHGTAPRSGGKVNPQYTA